MNQKEKQLKELLEYAKENYPLVAPLMNARMHHIKVKYAGVIGIAVAACQLFELVVA